MRWLHLEIRGLLILFHFAVVAIALAGINTSILWLSLGLDVASIDASVQHKITFLIGLSSLFLIFVSCLFFLVLIAMGVAAKFRRASA